MTDTNEPTPAAIRTLLEASIAAGVFSCAQLVVASASSDQPHVDIAIGTDRFETYGSPRTIDARTRFDLASLTKPLVTSLLTMRAVDDGWLAPATRLGAVISPALLHPTLRDVSIADLLRHRSGLDAWRPFFEDVPRHRWGTSWALEQVRSAVASMAARPDPPHVYSDPNYILLAWVLELTSGRPLDALFTSHIARPLGLLHTAFAPRHVDSEWPANRDDGLATVAATEVDPFDGLLSGVVHDDNTRAMGGVSGHAGLFGTARDVSTIARSLVAIDSASQTTGDGRFLVSQHTLRRFWDRRWLVGADHPGTHLLGWDTPSGELSSAGSKVSRTRAVGHLGFTGTSLWIDLDRRAWVVLLTNRVHPDRDEPRIRTLRPRVHDLCWAWVDA